MFSTCVLMMLSRKYTEKKQVPPPPSALPAFDHVKLLQHVVNKVMKEQAALRDELRDGMTSVRRRVMELERSANGAKEQAAWRDELLGEMTSIRTRVVELERAVLDLTGKHDTLQKECDVMQDQVTDLMYPPDKIYGSSSESDNDDEQRRDNRDGESHAISYSSRGQRDAGPYDGQDDSDAPYDGQDGWGDEYFAHNDDDSPRSL